MAGFTAFSPCSILCASGSLQPPGAAHSVLGELSTFLLRVSCSPPKSPLCQALEPPPFLSSIHYCSPGTSWVQSQAEPSRASRQEIPASFLI